MWVRKIPVDKEDDEDEGVKNRLLFFQALFSQLLKLRS